jgi:exonuclease SbcD
MRFLHTSDWHVGKALRGRDRSEEHRAVLAEITGIARERAVDFTLVCGDLFDSSAPTPEAERIVYHALLDLADVAPVLIVSGNHDNDRRLAAVQPLLDLGRVTARAMPARPEDGGVIDVDAGDERARVALLPWVSQRYIVRAEELMALRADQQAQEFAGRLADVVAMLGESFTPDTVNIIAGHAMVAGGTLGGGERLAHTIFEYCISPTAFPGGAHYVALGHLHRSQQLGRQPPVWYCGSPMQLDFGETDDDKGVLVVEASPATPAKAEHVPVRSGRRLRRVVGSFEQIEAMAGTTGEDWLRVVVQGSARAGLADDVRALFGEACIDVMIETEADREFGIEARSHEGKTPSRLFADYLTERDAADERVLTLFDELLREETEAPADQAPADQAPPQDHAPADA